MNLSILTCMRKHHLCQLSPRLKKPLSFALALSNLSDMPTSLSSQNKKVTQSLCQRQKIQKTKQKESETQTEKVRCQALPLSKLAEETLTDGQLKGKSRRQIYQEHAGYIHWLFGHQPNNTKFLKVMIYARRVEECQEKTAQSTKTLVKSSGEKNANLQRIRDRVGRADPSERILQDRKRKTRFLLKSMMPRFNEPRAQTQGLTEAGVAQQSAVYQNQATIVQTQQTRTCRTRRSPS